MKYIFTESKAKKSPTTEIGSTNYVCICNKIHIHIFVKDFYIKLFTKTLQIATKACNHTRFLKQEIDASMNIRVLTEPSATLTVGPRGPVLLQDFTFTDEMAHFNRERIPERVVHAKYTSLSKSVLKVKVNNIGSNGKCSSIHVASKCGLS